MNILPRLTVQVLFLIALSLWAQQETFTVMFIEGTARIQRSQKRTWEKLGPGNKIYDNDLIETFFQTRLILEFGAGNLVILGSNSKALLNIAAGSAGKKGILEASLTLFNGGVFSKARNSSRISIYTSNAVGILDSGSVTVVAEGKTGETGFQALGGLINVRNIAQQKGIELRPGLTTMIQPNKEPTAPLFITHRHVVVLKHYFGDDYITAELDASGIKPTDERSGASVGISAFTGGKSRGYTDKGMHKPLFSLNKIYGSILDDRAARLCPYRQITAVSHGGGESRGIVSLQTDFGISARGVSPRFMPIYSWQIGRFGGGLRLSFVKNAAGDFIAGFSSLDGILDKIGHLSFGTQEDSWYLYAGELRDVTFGYGLIVDHFTNIRCNRAFHPLGFRGRLRILDNMSVQAFASEVTAPMVSGIYFDFEPSAYHVGLGYVADFNQYYTASGASGMRYATLSRTSSLYPADSRNLSHVHCYCADLAADIIDRDDTRMLLAVEFAQKLFGGNDGFVARMPSFHFHAKKTSFGGGFIVESGRLLSSQFDAGYMENRYRIKNDLTALFMDTVITPNNFLSRKRRSLGVSMFFRMNPFRGTDIDLFYRQDLNGKHALNTVSADSIRAWTISGDFSFRIRAAINDSLVKFIRHGELTLHQSHGRLYPPEALPFAGWTFIAGYDVTTIPLFFNIAFETGGRFFYIDSGRFHDNRVEGNEFIAEIRIGIKWGF